jgi:hypothetical protein
MQGGFAAVSRYLASLILITFLINPHVVRANQIAQGYVQLSVTAQSSPQTITIATCELSVSTIDPTTFQSFSNDVKIEATVQSNIVSCTVVTPYYWSLTTLTGNPPTTGVIVISYTVGGQNGTAVVKTSSGSFDPIPLTTTGTTPLNISIIF